MILKWITELAYWFGYFAKWKSEKEISLFLGGGGVITFILVNILTILCIIELFTPWAVVEELKNLVPESIWKGGKSAAYPYALPPFLLLMVLLRYLMCRKKSKKEILAYFGKMPAKRQRIGKACFITYGVGSIVISLIGAAYLNGKKNVIDEDKQHQEYLESLWAEPYTKDSGKVDTVEQFDIIKQ